jgi:hypothetical protein
MPFFKTINKKTKFCHWSQVWSTKSKKAHVCSYLPYLLNNITKDTVTWLFIDRIHQRRTTIRNVICVVRGCEK